MTENQKDKNNPVQPPSGQETARFKMIDFDTHQVVFENPEHDFPQRIMYRLTAAGKLLGRIEGNANGTPRTADFPMTKVTCTGKTVNNPARTLP